MLYTRVVSTVHKLYTTYVGTRTYTHIRASKWVIVIIGILDARIACKRFTPYALRRQTNQVYDTYVRTYRIVYRNISDNLELNLSTKRLLAAKSPNFKRGGVVVVVGLFVPLVGGCVNTRHGVGHYTYVPTALKITVL